MFKSRAKIAVVELHGVIGNDIEDIDYENIFDKILKNNKYSGVILDIDSPGGSATVSHNIYEYIRNVSSKKPVVSYIRGLGASGGYYLACGSNTIVASRAAMIGSIGVIMVRPIYQQLMEKIGIEVSVVKSGAHKDMGGFWRKPTDAENEKFNNLISDCYNLFLDVVALGRSLPSQTVKEIATGEIYSANMAYNYKLIDNIGTMNDAINEVKKLSKLKGKYSIKRIKPKQPFFNKMIPSLMQKNSALSMLNDIQPFAKGGIFYM